MAKPLFKFGDHWNFANGDRVFVYNIDDSNKEWPGTIRGKSMHHIIDSYIVWMDEPINANYPYDCISITEGCIKPQNLSDPK